MTINKTQVLNFLKKCWIFILLFCILLILGLIQMRLKSPPISEGKPVTLVDKKEPGLSSLKNLIKPSNKATVSFTANQDQVQILFDQRLENLPQPLTTPVKIEIDPEQYTFQAIKTGFTTQTLSFEVKKNEVKEIKIELSPQIINPQFYQLLSETGPAGFGWKNNGVFYHFQNQIKDLETNKTVAVLPLNSQVSFSLGEAILVSSDNNLFIINQFPQLVNLNLKSTLTTISPSGTKLSLFNSNQELEFFDLKTLTKEGKFSLAQSGLKQVFWSDQENQLALVFQKENINNIYLLNLDNSEQKQIFSTSETINQAIFSPQNNNLLITTLNQALVYNFNNQKTKTIEPAPGLKNNLGFWRGEDELILIEKVSQNNRIIDKIWQIELKSLDKKFLLLSAPLSRRINFKNPPVLAKDKNALLLAENDGPLWLFLLQGSLKDYFPKSQLPPEDYDYAAP